MKKSSRNIKNIEKAIKNLKIAPFPEVQKGLAEATKKTIIVLGMKNDR